VTAMCGRMSLYCDASVCCARHEPSGYRCCSERGCRHCFAATSDCLTWLLRVNATLTMCRLSYSCGLSYCWSSCVLAWIRLPADTMLRRGE
jgi:hypothetical protein